MLPPQFFTLIPDVYFLSDNVNMQALLSILPISQIPSLPSCVQYISSLLPVEEIFGLEHPSLKAPPVEDKRTWRGPRNPAATPSTESDTVKKPGDIRTWTAMDIMQAYANKKRWVTAKAGRPDVNRAGNASALSSHSCDYPPLDHLDFSSS
jgi:hypothetical protein